MTKRMGRDSERSRCRPRVGALRIRRAVATLLVWTLAAPDRRARATCRLISRSGAGDVVWPLRPWSFAFVGALVASRQPDNPIGWIFCGGAVAFSLSGLGEAYAVYTLFAEPGLAVRRRRDGSVVLGLGVGPGRRSAADPVPLAVPERRAAFDGAGAIVAGAAFAAIAFLVVGTMFAPGPLEDLPEVENPYGLGGVARRRLRCFQGRGLAAPDPQPDRVGASLVLRFRRSRGIERQQLKWVAAAGVRPRCRLPRGRSGRAWPPLGILTMVVAAGHRDPALPPLRHRRRDQPHAGLRCADGDARARVPRRRAAAAARAATADRELQPRDRRLDARRRGALPPGACAHPGGRRPPLLPAQVRRAAHARALSPRGCATRSTSRLNSELSAVVKETLQPAHVSLWLRMPR